MYIVAWLSCYNKYRPTLVALVYFWTIYSHSDYDFRLIETRMVNADNLLSICMLARNSEEANERINKKLDVIWTSYRIMSQEQ